MSLSAVMGIGMLCVSKDGRSPAPNAGHRDRYAVPEDDAYKSPIQLALTKDGSRLYVACENSDEVLAVDTAARRVTGSVKVGRHPFGLALNPSETELFVSSRWDNSISVVDTAKMTVRRTLHAGDDPHQLCVDPGG